MRYVFNLFILNLQSTIVSMVKHLNRGSLRSLTKSEQSTIQTNPLNHWSHVIIFHKTIEVLQESYTHAWQIKGVYECAMI